MPAIHRPLETVQHLVATFGTRPFTLAEAERVGVSRAQLRAARGRQLLVAPRHGQYAVRRTDDADARREHLDAVRAALLAAGPHALATGASAAAVLALPTSSTASLDRVTLAHPGVSDFAGPGLVVRGSRIDPSFAIVVDGIATTDLRRTAVDLARGRTLADGLVPIDAAMRGLVATWCGAGDRDLRTAVLDHGLRDRARRELEYAATACRGWPGIVAARRAIAYADPAAESPFESRCRAWFLSAGITGLEVGVPITVHGRTYWADFCSRDHRVIGEADGWQKYGADLDTVRARLTLEKQRHAALEGAGWRIVRWTTQDTRRSIVDRMRTALRSP
jgi:hypothetical protein